MNNLYNAKGERPLMGPNLKLQFSPFLCSALTTGAN